MATLFHKRTVYGAHARRRTRGDDMGQAGNWRAHAGYGRRTPSIRRIVAIGTAFATLAVIVAGQPAVAQELKRGEELLNKNCAVCHAVARSGESPNKLAPPFRTLGQRYPIESLEEALGEGIMSGHPDMPEFSFDAGDVGAIIAYLKSIQR
jgi:cytochrome c